MSIWFLALSDLFVYKNDEIKQQKTRSNKQKQEEVNKEMAKKVQKPEKDNIEYDKPIKSISEIEFEAHECFKIFDTTKDIKLCDGNTERQVISPTQFNNGKSGIVPQSWIITVNKCVSDLQGYLEVCIDAFKKAKFNMCKPLDTLPKVRNDIKIEAQITTVFESRECFKAFRDEGIKMCLWETDIQVVFPSQLDDCSNNNTCMSISSWIVTKSDCIQEYDYSIICKEAFKTKGIFPCITLDDSINIKENDILKNADVAYKKNKEELNMNMFAQIKYKKEQVIYYENKADDISNMVLEYKKKAEEYQNAVNELENGYQRQEWNKCEQPLKDKGLLDEQIHRVCNIYKCQEESKQKNNLSPEQIFEICNKKRSQLQECIVKEWDNRENLKDSLTVFALCENFAPKQREKYYNEQEQYRACMFEQTQRAGKKYEDAAANCSLIAPPPDDPAPDHYPPE